MSQQTRIDINFDNSVIKIKPNILIHRNNTNPIINIEELKIMHSNCSSCDLYKDRKCDVFSSGPIDSPIILIGEALGKNENNNKLNLYKSPFIGMAGNKLNEMLHKVGLSRSDIYVTNAVKDWPYGNRTPNKFEIESCFPFLEQEIKLYPRKVLIPLGVTALISITQFKHTTLKSVQFKKLFFDRIPILPTYHPASVLRTPTFEDAVLKTFEKAKEISKL